MHLITSLYEINKLEITINSSHRLQCCTKKMIKLCRYHCATNWINQCKQLKIVDIYPQSVSSSVCPFQSDPWQQCLGCQVELSHLQQCHIESGQQLPGTALVTCYQTADHTRWYTHRHRYETRQSITLAHNMSAQRQSSTAVKTGIY